MRPKTPVTINDVAAAAGVSTATVSRVLNRSLPVAEATAARVRAAADQLGYVPQAAARHLAQGATSTLGLLLPGVSDDFFLPLVRSITECAAEAGYTLLIAIRPAGRDGQAHQLPLGKQNTDGLLIFDQSLYEGELRRLHAMGFPVVLLYHSPPADLSAPCVVIENREGMRAITEHLITRHGRRRIAFLRGPAGNEDAQQREEGYRAALAAHGIPFDPALVGVGEFQEGPAQATVAHWLAESRSFDAVVAGDDGSAAGALEALRQAGRRVPHDVSVVGFDDAPRARYLSPRLTTVRALGDEVGRAAIRQLLCLIAGQPAEPRIILPTDLVIRQSCGCL